MEQKIFEIVARVMKVDVSAITEDSSPKTLLNWDSMEHMMLIFAIEEAFGLQLSDSEIATIADVKSLAQVVKAKQGA